MIAARATALPATQIAESSRRTGLLHEIGEFWRQFLIAAFDPYRPERHYMRGPGPACRAREQRRS